MKLPFWCIAALALAAHTASAQPGNQSDVTGPSTTSSAIAGGAFAPSPGTIAVPLSPAAQAAVTRASAVVATRLAAGTLTTPSGVAIPAAAQAVVLSVLTGQAVTTGAAATLATTLTNAGAPFARTDALVESLAGLLSNPAPGQLASAIGNYNALVLGVRVSFLANPPPTFLAIQAALATIIAAATAAS